MRRLIIIVAVGLIRQWASVVVSQPNRLRRTPMPRTVVLFATVILFLVTSTDRSRAQSPLSSEQPALKSPVTIYGITFPPMVEGIPLFNVQNYERIEAGRGYSVGYGHKNQTVTTIYVYDSGQKEVPDSLSDPGVQREFELSQLEILRALKMDYYSVVSFLNVFELSTMHDKTPRLLCVVLVLTNREKVSNYGELCVGSAKGKFVKIRTTFPVGAKFVRGVGLAPWVHVIWPTKEKDMR